MRSTTKRVRLAPGAVPILDVEDLIKKSHETTAQSTESLTQWYHQNRRKLAWRGDAVPPEVHDRPVSAYGVWVSEVMCQQTRVETAHQYWLKFMKAFPTPKDLAAATLDQVNAQWAGLGYYRRARLLHEGAKDVCLRFDGVLPNTREDLLSIPGIGPYTSGAVGSICFGLPIEAVDGNVVRVFTRLHAFPDRSAKDKGLIQACTRLARDFVQTASSPPRNLRPGDVNQALMELGATVCTPRAPTCSACPLAQHCKAYDSGSRSAREIADQFPAPPEKKTRSPVSNVTVALVLRGDAQSNELEALSLRRPSDDGLLAGMWEFVCVPTSAEGDAGAEDSDVEEVQTPSNETQSELERLKARMREYDVCPSCLARAELVSREVFRPTEFKHVFSHLVHVCRTEALLLRPSAEATCSCRLSSDKTRWIKLTTEDAKKWRVAPETKIGLTKAMLKTIDSLELTLAPTVYVVE